METLMMTASAPHPQSTTPAARRAAGLATTVLASHNREAVEEIAPAAFAGRNGTWNMRLRNGEKVFVKQISPQASGPMAFDRSVTFAAFAEQSPDFAPATPQLIGSDTANGLLVFEHCPGTSLAHLMVEETMPDSFPEEAGALLARLHAAPAIGLERSAPPSPPVEMLAVGVPHARYLEFTMAEMALWSELQNDQELVAAAGRLRASERMHQERPIHGDLRLDQFHLHNGKLCVLDWEEFGLGDPARDLGMLAGEWIYRAVLDTVTTRGGASAPPARFDDESASARIAERMAAIVPSIRRMWTSYAEHANYYDPDLPVRATAHVGWHLVDRTITRAPMVSRLPGIERAAAGVGREALLSPGHYVKALGFERTPR
ncbi:hypothetical protein ARUE_c05100 [Arthrobacter sp. Rue61a]|nr:hypothetical protein ARUE_c05100 [Arthrobacter sp. Rue61a]